MASFIFYFSFASVLLVLLNTLGFIGCVELANGHKNSMKRNADSADLRPISSVSGLETDIDDILDTTVHEQSELLKLKAACVEGRYGCRRKRTLSQHKQEPKAYPSDFGKVNSVKRKNHRSSSISKRTLRQHPKEILKPKREADEIDIGIGSRPPNESPSNKLDGAHFNKPYMSLPAPFEEQHEGINTPSKKIREASNNSSISDASKLGETTENKVNRTTFDNSLSVPTGASTNKTIHSMLHSNMTSNTNTTNSAVNIDQDNRSNPAANKPPQNISNESNSNSTESVSEDAFVNINSTSLNNSNSIADDIYARNESIDKILKKLESTIEDKIGKEDLLDRWLARNQEFEQAFGGTNDELGILQNLDNISRRDVNDHIDAEIDDSSITYEEIDNDPNDGYTPWGEWGPCSSTCGLGRSERRRLCKNLQHCQSGDIEIKMCGLVKC